MNRSSNIGEAAEVWAEVERATRARLLARGIRSPEARADTIAAEAKDKEPFDYPKFCALYWRKDPQGDISPGDSNSVKEQYRIKYYLDFPELKTLSDFATKLELLDAQSGN